MSPRSACPERESLRFELPFVVLVFLAAEWWLATFDPTRGLLPARGVVWGLGCVVLLRPGVGRRALRTLLAVALVASAAGLFVSDAPGYRKSFVRALARLELGSSRSEALDVLAAQRISSRAEAEDELALSAPPDHHVFHERLAAGDFVIVRPARISKWAGGDTCFLTFTEGRLETFTVYWAGWGGRMTVDGLD